MSAFFAMPQKPLAIGATLYLVLLLVSHWQINSAYVWGIAAFFSIAMNFTYLTEAITSRNYVTTEAIVSFVLIVFSLLGLLLSPLFVIAAIFGHGCWDLAKHFGRGVPFYFWYTCSCFLVDTAYSTTLLLYWFRLAS